MAAHSVPEEQAKYAGRFLESLKTPADLTAAAKLIAANEGIKIKSARRRLERYTAGERTLKGGKKSTAKQRYSFAKSAMLPNLIEDLPVSAITPVTFTVRATFDFYGNDKRHRTINFPCNAKDTKKVLEGKNKTEWATTLAGLKAFAFLESATISKIDHVKVIDYD